ncbi:MAG: hypothetical protein F6K53_36120 [Moorea sp. SIO4A1]|uniref:hypothetical protein n=1 Tax=Moorena sp. SIO4A1 TaxID=2607835 RepID=UPI0013B84CEA|nr:hypothetical protein [Moorena sp. SIO4A1]NEQ03493.1 hypothetical protein [Moorena sp. SIO3F7]NEQ62523.1 hypothetical protein [Moorena sp. SIO4A1]NEQ82550.1 hypothetical protein [Moorena sp. SIO2I5]
MPTKTQKAMGTLVGGHCSGDFGQVGELETGFSHPTSYSGWWALLRSIPAGLGDPRLVGWALLISIKIVRL